MTGEKTLPDAENHNRVVIDECCVKLLSALAENEATNTAGSILRESIAAATKPLAERLTPELDAEINNVIALHLLNPALCPQVTQITREKAQQAARRTIIDSVFRRSKEKSFAAAQEAAAKFLTDSFLRDGKDTFYRYLDNKLQDYSGPTMSENDLRRFLTDAVPEDVGAELLSADRRREVQKISESAAGQVAAQAQEEEIKEPTFLSARKIATETVQIEITKFVTAEARSRVAKNVRDFLETKIGENRSEKQEQYWLSRIDQIADETVDAVLAEVINPTSFTLNDEPVRQLVFQTARTTTNDIVENITSSQGRAPKRMPPSVFLGIQIATACFLIWLLLLGGNAKLSGFCQPYLKTILPPNFYSLIYPRDRAPDEMTPVEEEPLSD